MLGNLGPRCAGLSSEGSRLRVSGCSITRWWGTSLGLFFITAQSHSHRGLLCDPVTSRRTRFLIPSYWNQISTHRFGGTQTLNLLEMGGGFSDEWTKGGLHVRDILQKARDTDGSVHYYSSVHNPCHVQRTSGLLTFLELMKGSCSEVARSHCE